MAPTMQYGVMQVRVDTIATEGSTNGGDNAASITLYLGVGMGVGSFLLIIIAVMTALIIRQRMQLRRSVAGLEEQPDVRRVGDFCRPTSIRCSSGSGIAMQQLTGWNALGSNENIVPEPMRRKDCQRRRSLSSISTRKYSFPLKRQRHLSAIIEGQRTSDPSLTLDNDAATTTAAPPNPDRVDSAVAERNDSPLLQDLASCFPPPPLFADLRHEQARSFSAADVVSPNDDVFGHPQQHMQVRSRSLSLGHAGPPPSGPVPSLPSSLPMPLRRPSDASNRLGLCVSRHSTSSQDSTGSSVLITSPLLEIRKDADGKTAGVGSSPTVEQVVADDDNAQLKAVWQNPLISGPQPRSEGPPLAHPKARYSSVCGTIISFVPSTCESEDRLYVKNPARLSVPLPDRSPMSRLSSAPSIYRPNSGAQSLSTPRKQRCSIPSVSANGSPAERVRRASRFASTVGLQPISHNAVSGLSRQTSFSTQNSNHSSNGNPFQWDTQQLIKPSALKGSPNSRRSKGHKRQNCVRISLLGPQVLGPPPSRPTSPSVMRIEEESDEIKPIAPLRLSTIRGALTSRTSRDVYQDPPTPPSGDFAFDMSSLLSKNSTQSNRASLLSEPCSPKSQPKQQPNPPKPPIHWPLNENLTSSNTSAILASMPDLPPIAPSSPQINQNLWPKRSVSLRLPPLIHSSNSPQMPSPLHIPTNSNNNGLVKPSGPRDPNLRTSILRDITSLRRMNSEMSFASFPDYSPQQGLDLENVDFAELSQKLDGSLAGLGLMPPSSPPVFSPQFSPPTEEETTPASLLSTVTVDIDKEPHSGGEGKGGVYTHPTKVRRVAGQLVRLSSGSLDTPRGGTGEEGHKRSASKRSLYDQDGFLII